MKVISIVPRLPPAIDGVGDYALNLARQLRQDFEIDTQFIVCDPTWVGDACIEGFAITKIEGRSATALLKLLQQQEITTVLLQLSGYGYAKWALTYWLAQGLARWKQQVSNSHLVTMFHELYTPYGMPWQHNFWVSCPQRQLAKWFVQLSNACLTSTTGYAQSIQTFSRSKQTQGIVLPIPSNIGEPKTVLPLIKRQPRLVIFGQYLTRRRAYQESLPQLQQICAQLEIKEILDIGKPVNLDLSTIGSVPIIEKGECSALEISQIMSEAKAGFLHYQTRLLPKSGVFAAYCAHGLLPVIYPQDTLSFDDTQPGKHYWAIVDSKQPPPSLDRFQNIADSALNWYRDHQLSTQAHIFAKVLTKQETNQLVN